MKSYFHCIVWLDHSEARIYRFDATDFEQVIVRSDIPNLPLDKHYLAQVAEAVSRSGAILITGPASAKTELVAHIRERLPHLSARIRAVEPLDHPSDGQLLKHGRQYFRADDRMHAQVHS